MGLAPEHLSVYELTIEKDTPFADLAGQGNLDLPLIIKALRDVEYQGVYTIEYGIEEDSPLTGTALTVGYIQGILAALYS